MRRTLIPASQRNNESLLKRLRVRQGVISLINDSINDPEMRTADETIVAVLHVLNSEVMGCDDRSMRIHQVGLHEMIRERGGLDRLGVGGQLAGILTITNYLIGAVREMQPHPDYVSFASKQDTSIPSDTSRLPESPIYCRPQGFQKIAEVLSSRDETYELLDTLRRLTNRFYLEKVFAALPAWEKDFTDMSERYTYEAIRLAALIYAYALLHKIPFSKAAAEVRNSKSFYLPDSGITPMPILINKALMRTDTSHCWDHLAGVLFWVVLVACAAVNPGPLANEERDGEDEDARKWLSAIAVRCCIVLSFEHGHAVMETLKRIVAIEAVLGRSSSDSANHNDDETATETMKNLLRKEKDADPTAFGPQRPPPVQRGFADFAQELMNI
ncbi:hypothetical protein LTR37_006519 [Vermiconidia calcicola]|uniref:Uncharacterized protein n=1 Tax=Vermiconidia calcicola TaxID=1690605 RepID=A0ACC3NHA9_9PEZI|nr:hypothetical protein LTR37_006519 [Vermiconidia calcicola]